MSYSKSTSRRLAHGPTSGHRLATLLMLVGSIGVIVGALLFQYVGGLEPCELCLIERWPYYTGIPLLALAWVVHRYRKAALCVLFLAAALFLAGATISFYHVGVEQHWFAGPTACTSPAMEAHTIEALRAQLTQQEPVRCDVVQWSLFGVSLAGLNLIASLVLAALSLVGLREEWRFG
jgi:disulfide bond formation protein DsbB